MGTEHEASSSWIRSIDQEHVWHPYATVPAAHPPLVVRSGRGAWLRIVDEGGTERAVLDGMSSWWSAIHGYAHPVLDRAVTEQLGSISHVMFGGLTHEPAARLARILVEVTPEPLHHVFLADSGSVSVEVALKMCLQYWRSRGRPEKRRMLTWRGGYHGDTFHAMSVCDPEGGMHRLWGDTLPRQVFVDAPPSGVDVPPDPSYLDHMEELLARHAHEVAAIIVEPIVQGAGGMRFHHPGYLTRLRELADTYDVLLVFDEIATGFGRTGELFAADHAGVSPDVMCLGKALTGGYMTMAATLCTSRVARGIAGGEVPVLAHGPTFMGNPLAAAVAHASVDLLRQRDWRAEVSRISEGLATGLAPARSLPTVADVRVLGAIGVIELAAGLEVDIPAATRAALDAHVWLRPFRNLIYAMPPYICDDAEIAGIASGMLAAARAGTGNGQTQ
ncbi:adenosylmethionine--8-amino-7-oxononanoate transaminase [Lipingzhangella sp. LS1_29]|uniref:Adenosylmethionine-8-amino-7-oxononanoate aminotransferase n=1 Tax=Lipingzhangella rawalii TaxID=2055835 RepID=A0ABU2H810_9ACTN|nr:adenosylmethionine--8-amino-7-oxononanoate transaminase [Lipingzhangella rawalii]MDS1270990.1 adenosylmethionine--8-amino-7-oxononanoate transaminase [Lipingzhangella rawalii]